MYGPSAADSCEPGLSSGAAHWLQNLLSGGLSAPHDRQAEPNGAPHWPQNFVPAGLSAWHREHLMWSPQGSAGMPVGAGQETDEGELLVIGKRHNPVMWCFDRLLTNRTRSDPGNRAQAREAVIDFWICGRCGKLVHVQSPKGYPEHNHKLTW